MSSFEVFVSNDSFKFNAAHFVAYRGYRERLHGHNYRVSVRLRSASSKIGPDGYVMDFGCIKAVTRQICKELNEHFLCPTLSDVIQITTTTVGSSDQEQQQVQLQCEDGSIFVFPRQDCAMLPLVHATTEELAIYLWSRLYEGLHPTYLRDRGIQSMEVTVAEAPNQEATFCRDIPPPLFVANNSDDADETEGCTATRTHHLDVRDFIQRGEVVPMPCLADDKRCPHCQR